MPDHATGISVMLRGECVLLVRTGQRSGFTRSADLADELTWEAAELLARDLSEAANEIRRRKASD